MNITENKDRKTYDINVNQFELDVLNFVAARIGGSGKAREVFNFSYDSLLNICSDYDYVDWEDLKKKYDIEFRGSGLEFIKFEPKIEVAPKIKQLRDKIGRFAVNLDRFLNKTVRFDYQGNKDINVRCRFVRICKINNDWFEGEDLHDYDNYKRFLFMNVVGGHKGLKVKRLSIF